MPSKINPSEVSDILYNELKDVNSEVQFEEVGKVLQVNDGVARLYGLRNATENELLEFENGTKSWASRSCVKTLKEFLGV